jgi:hypothetical protein
LDLCLIGPDAIRGANLGQVAALATDFCRLLLTLEIIATNFENLVVCALRQPISTSSPLGDSTSRRLSLRGDGLHHLQERRFMIATFNHSSCGESTESRVFVA